MECFQLLMLIVLLLSFLIIALIDEASLLNHEDCGTLCFTLVLVYLFAYIYMCLRPGLLKVEKNKDFWRIFLGSEFNLKP